MSIAPNDPLMREMQGLCRNAVADHPEIFGLGDAAVDKEWWMLLNLLTLPEAMPSRVVIPILHPANSGRNEPIRTRVLALTLGEDVWFWKDLIEQGVEVEHIRPHLAQDKRDWHSATQQWFRTLKREQWLFIQDWLREVMPLLDRYYLARTKGRRTIDRIQAACRHYFFYMSLSLPPEEVCSGKLPVFWPGLGDSLNQERENEGWEFNELLLGSTREYVREQAWQQLMDSLLPPDELKLEVFQDLRRRMLYWKDLNLVWDSFLQLQKAYLAVPEFSLAAALPFQSLVELARQGGAVLDEEKVRELVVQNIPHTCLSFMGRAEDCRFLATYLEDDPDLMEIKYCLLNHARSAEGEEGLKRAHWEAFSAQHASVFGRLNFLTRPV